MISPAERQERISAMEDVIGTHRAEGIALDEATLKLMTQYADGELSLAQFSAAMRAYAYSLETRQKPLVNAA